jgi:histidinol phosphatase-like PHP family hydrolase
MDIHNHTIWSDGLHKPEEIIENAIDNGLEVIGISDHYYTDKCKSISSKDLPTYIEELNNLKEQYRDSIKVKIGVEICMNRLLVNLNKLPYELLNKLDYVLFEYLDYAFLGTKHDDWNKYSVKLKNIGPYVDKLTCDVGLSHADPFILAKIYGNDDILDGLEDVISYIKKYKVFWEFNVSQSSIYFNHIMNNRDAPEVKKLLKLLKDKDIHVKIGSDTHNLKDFYIGDIEDAYKLIKEEL